MISVGILCFCHHDSFAYLKNKERYRGRGTYRRRGRFNLLICSPVPHGRGLVMEPQFTPPAMVAGTQLPELALLPPKASIRRKPEYWAGAQTQIQESQHGRRYPNWRLHFVAECLPPI